ncbi:MAG: hypothetical protein AVDCRST_MAG04-3135, partial [uncultured Acetobacteraceae bacterium]
GRRRGEGGQERSVHHPGGDAGSARHPHGWETKFVVEDGELRGSTRL